MMKTQHLNILRYLSEQNKAITAADLAAALHCSIRSVKNYIQELKQSYPGLISSSRTGYKVNQNILPDILPSRKEVPQSSAERVVYIMTSLLNERNGIHHYDLCDTLFISYSTLKSELSKVKKELAQFNLTLEITNDILTIRGTEKNKRKLLSTILYNESSIHFVNLEIIQNYFPDIRLPLIKQIILNAFDQYHYFVNDYALISLIIHIAIAIDRIRNNNLFCQIVTEVPSTHTQELGLARQITMELEKAFAIHYTDSEVYELSLLLISRATSLDYTQIRFENLESLIGKDCFSLVNDLIASVQTYYYIDLSEPEFLIRFALHIKNLLLRSQNNYYSKNPLTEEIKTSCPLIYDVSVFLSSLIKEKTGISIIDDEIAYIAFHIGSTLQAQKGLTSKIKAVLYCPNYYDIKIKLVNQINYHFEEQLIITNIIMEEGELSHLQNCDLIITTLPITSILPVSSVLIRLFLSEKDIYLLRKKLEELKFVQKQAIFASHLRSLITSELFEIRSDFENEQQVIDYMTGKLEALDYVDENYRSEIYKREQLSSTAFYGFSIPHPMKMNAKKTGIFVLLSKTPILWSEKPIQMVIMLCFNASTRHIFYEIFEPLTRILSERDAVLKASAAKNYEDFIMILAKLYQ